MSSTVVFGPYFWQTNLPPGGAHNFSIGPDSRLDAPSVIHCTGHPVASRRNSNFAIWLSDMSVQCIDRGHGDINRIETTVFATHGNSGVETVRSYSAWFTVTRP